MREDEFHIKSVQNVHRLPVHKYTACRFMLMSLNDSIYKGDDYSTHLIVKG